MKKYAFLLILMACSAPAFSQDEEEPGQRLKTIELYAAVSQGVLLSGTQLELVRDSLLPRPTQFQYISLSAGLRVFPSQNLGLEGSGELGFTTVNSFAARAALATYYHTVFSVGPVLRLSYPLSDSALLGFHFGAGGNYSILQYTDQYKSVFDPDTYFYEVSPGLGYYGKAGLALYPNAPICFGVDLEYRNLHNYIAASRTNLDGGYFKLSAWAGLAF